jgi:hypothetical protein
MSEFVPVLVGAILLMIFAMMFMTIVDYSGEASYYSYKQGSPVYAKGYNTATIFLDEDLTIKAETEVIEEFTTRVARSLFNHQSVTVEITPKNTYSRGIIEFHVGDTNHLGSLIFKIDDTEAYRKLTERGDYSFEFNPAFLKNSTLSISAGAPALLFWDETYYDIAGQIKGMNVWEGYYNFPTNSDMNYTFFADIEESTGWVSVYLNDKEIYSGDPDEDEDISINLSREPLKEKNTLRISPHEGSAHKFELVEIFGRKY